MHSYTSSNHALASPALENQRFSRYHHLSKDRKWYYIGSKKTPAGLRIAIEDQAKEFISFVTGDRSTKTGKEL